MAIKTYKVTLEITVDTSEGLGDPGFWNYTHMLGAGARSVNVSVADAFETCCDAYIWSAEAGEDLTQFAPYLHDDDCPNFVPIEDDFDEDESDEAVAEVFSETVTAPSASASV